MPGHPQPASGWTDWIRIWDGGRGPGSGARLRSCFLPGWLGSPEGAHYPIASAGYHNNSLLLRRRQETSRRSIFDFPDVYNQFLAGSLKINLHQSSYRLINIASYNMNSPAQTKPELIHY